MLLIEEGELEGTYEFIKRKDFNKISVLILLILFYLNLLIE